MTQSEGTGRIAAPVLGSRPTLHDLQQYVRGVCEERGWTRGSPAEKFNLFVEEIGELAKALRKRSGLYHEEARARAMSVEEEFADVLSYLLDLADCHGVDLEQAFRDKEQANSRRVWK